MAQVTVNDLDVLPMFATPLSRSRLNNISQEVRDFVVKQDYVRMPSNDGDYSVNKHILECPELADLKAEIQSHASLFTHEFLGVDNKFNFQITNSWIVKHHKGDSGGKHRHVNSLLSAVLYIDTDNDTGDILFHKEDNLANVFTDVIKVEYKADVDLNIYNTQVFRIRPQNNMLVMFPSWVRHSVLENESDKTRYCIAMNFFPKGTFGESEIDQLTII
jgi:uncharacterized protein (TIGR02466 family)